MINLIDLLSNIFNKLDDTIAYLDTSNGLVYRQKNRSIRVVSVYFKITTNNFIKRSTIENNKEVLSRLRTFQLENLITTTLLDNGFSFSVYDQSGNLIYKQRVLLYDESWWIVQKLLKRKYPELVLDSRKP